MKPPKFEYYAPQTVEEVVALLTRFGMDARVLAGGQSLVPIMNLRIMQPAALIDLNRCEALDYIELRDGHIAIGAMVRQMDAMNSPVVRQHCPLVSQALELAGPVAVRNRATVGGTLAHADRVAELPSVAVALDAVMVIQGSAGSREVGAADFFFGDLTTAVEPGEFLSEVRFPVCAADAYTSFQEVSVRQEGVAVVGLAAYLERKGATIRRTALAAMGVDGAPVRLRGVEAVLTSRRLGESSLIEEAERALMSETDPMSDVYASAAYRKHAVRSMLANVLKGAAQENL